MKILGIGNAIVDVICKVVSKCWLQNCTCTKQWILVYPPPPLLHGHLALEKVCSKM